ncbi:heterokaryon incompatibility, partial [Halenospora varia]
LQSVSLDDHPAFEALSYIWGNEKPNCCITCNGSSLNIRPNFNALKRLRNSSEPRVIWIDAICINQEDLIEENHQIPLMRSIYKNAERTIVWLGGESKGISKAVDLMRSFLEIDNHGFFYEPWEALAELISWSWFRRIWVIQEVVLVR